MAGCELNIAPAFVAAPTAHHRRIRHDAIVTSADDFDSAMRRSRSVTDVDEDTSGGRAAGMIPHYRMVPCSLAHGAGSEWVTLSKSVLLQLVERICQLSFQTDSLPSAAAATVPPTDSPVSSPSERRHTSAAMSVDVAESCDHSGGRSSLLTLAGAPSDGDRCDVPAETVDPANTESLGVMPVKDQDVVDNNPAPADRDMQTCIDVDGEPGKPEADCDQEYSEVSTEFTSNVPMQEGGSDDQSTNDTSLLPVSPCSRMLSVDELQNDSVVCVDPPTATQKSVGSVPFRSSQSLRTDRRRRLRELRRLSRHHQRAASADHQPHGPYRGRRRDTATRRRFAVPRQPPPCLQHRRPTDVDDRFYGASTDVPTASRLSVGRRHGRILCQPWSALNKVVVCQLVDIVLNQELSPMTGAWRPAAAATATAPSDKRRPSGTIWNPAISPDTRECASPTPQQRSPTVEDVSPVKSSFPFDATSSSLLHTMLAPVAAATTYLDRRRSETSAADPDVDGSLAWSMTSARRRRHHSAAGPDTFHPPWTPSFFWYNVPPTQGSFFALPDAAAASPCFRWITVNQSPSMPPASAALDACALDYRVRTLDSVACPDVMDARDAVYGRQYTDVPKRCSSRSSTPPASVAGAEARPKWVVVNKTDVCSLFESLASSMVADGDDTPRPLDETGCAGRDSVIAGGAGPDSGAAAAAAGEPIKWKSTLLRRARAEAQTPQRSDSNVDAPLNRNN